MRVSKDYTDYKNRTAVVRLQADLYQRLTDRAALDAGGNISALIRRAIAEYLERAQSERAVTDD